jgi:hypothetical protein
MVARPQNSARGNVAKAKFIIPTGGGIRADDYSTTSDLVTANSTALLIAGGIRLSGQAFYLTGNATGNKFSGALYLSNKTAHSLKGTSTGFKSSGGITLSNRTARSLTANSTAIILSGALYLNSKKYIYANSTGLGLIHSGTKPTTAGTATLAFNTDSTGRYLSIRQTGGTWLYVQQTAVRPPK